MSFKNTKFMLKLDTGLLRHIDRKTCVIKTFEIESSSLDYIMTFS